MHSQTKFFWLNTDELHYYLLMVNLGRCFEKSSNTVNNPFGRISIPWKIENVNLKLFNIIKKINESKKLMKHNSWEFWSDFVGRKCNSIQKQNEWECL